MSIATVFSLEGIAAHVTLVLGAALLGLAGHYLLELKARIRAWI